MENLARCNKANINFLQVTPYVDPDSDATFRYKLIAIVEYQWRFGQQPGQTRWSRVPVVVAHSERLPYEKELAERTYRVVQELRATLEG